MGFLAAARGTGSAWADARLYNAKIRRNIKLAESCSFGQTVLDYAPRSNGAIDYTRLAVPDEVLRELQRVTELVLAEEAEKDESFREILESQQAFRATYAHWKSRAYLPRDF